MALAQKKLETIFTIEEYLKYERAADFRSEYIEGEIFAMAGESDNHADISANLVILLGSQLKGTPCRVRTKDTKVRSGEGITKRYPPKNMFSYPDLVVICGEPKYHDEFRDIIVNPTVLIEVLSDSTEFFDRVDKFKRYQKWSLTIIDYILVSQYETRIEHYNRQQDETWLLEIHENLSDEFLVESINCKVNLNDVYDRIAFKQSDSQMFDEE
ncbi:MAG: Uma2 family endonuclease [Pyrinomonadaceae bacterium]|nr:Uma2 family endonuclease [Pyrinomonadaceae bacterium]